MLLNTPARHNASGCGRAASYPSWPGGQVHGSGLGVCRYVVERTFAWLKGFRRLRFERTGFMHEAAFNLAMCVRRPSVFASPRTGPALAPRSARRVARATNASHVERATGKSGVDPPRGPPRRQRPRLLAVAEPPRRTISSPQPGSVHLP